jgi:hypothetical protein
LVRQAVGCLATVASRAKLTLDREFVLQYVFERIRENSEELFLKVKDRSVKNFVHKEAYDPRTIIDLSCVSDLRDTFIKK